jgi:hypothetical protein
MCFSRLVKAERLGPGGYLDAGGCKEGLNIAMTAVSLMPGRGALALMLRNETLTPERPRMAAGK